MDAEERKALEQSILALLEHTSDRIRRLPREDERERLESVKRHGRVLLCCSQLRAESCSIRVQAVRVCMWLVVSRWKFIIMQSCRFILSE